MSEEEELIVIEEVPTRVKDRVKNTFYWYKDTSDIRYWNGIRLLCKHKKAKNRCIQCNGSDVEYNSNVIDLPPVSDREKDNFYCYKGISVYWNGKILLCKHKKRGGICTQCNEERKEEKKDTSILKELPTRIKNRMKNTFYLEDNIIVFWTGKELQCEHKRRKHLCKECNETDNEESDEETGTESEFDEENEYPKLPTQARYRKKDKFYIYEDRVMFWNGKELLCSHKKREHRCLQCTDIRKDFCEHNKTKYSCVYCAKNRNSFCKLCDFMYVANGQYKPYCFKCYCYLNPDEKIPVRFKQKQHYIRDKIKEKYDDFIYDKPIDGGCSKKRPDFLFDQKTHSTMIEVDEIQHDYHGYSCENKRIMSIFKDLAKRPLVVIRFNPDEYDNKKGCFSFDKKNRLVVNEEEFDVRMEKLLEVLKYHLENIPDKELTIIKLFFDE